LTRDKPISELRHRLIADMIVRTRKTQHDYIRHIGLASKAPSGGIGQLNPSFPTGRLISATAILAADSIRVVITDTLLR
jgi:hypothetical protein